MPKSSESPIAPLEDDDLGAVSGGYSLGKLPRPNPKDQAEADGRYVNVYPPSAPPLQWDCGRRCSYGYHWAQRVVAETSSNGYQWWNYVQVKCYFCGAEHPLVQLHQNSPQRLM